MTPLSFTQPLPLLRRFALGLLACAGCASPAQSTAGDDLMAAQQGYDEAYCEFLACGHPDYVDACDLDDAYADPHLTDLAACHNDVAADYPAVEERLECMAETLRMQDECFRGLMCVDRFSEFSCGDGQTIPGAQRCDEAPDCADGRDEEGCPDLDECLIPALAHALTCETLEVSEAAEDALSACGG